MRLDLQVLPIVWVFNERVQETTIFVYEGTHWQVPLVRGVTEVDQAHVLLVLLIAYFYVDLLNVVHHVLVQLLFQLPFGRDHVGGGDYISEDRVDVVGLVVLQLITLVLFLE